MLKHVVFMKFKPAATDEDILDLEKALGTLPGTIPEIKGYEFGRDIVKSERSYDFALVSTFESLETISGSPRPCSGAGKSEETGRKYFGGRFSGMRFSAKMLTLFCMNYGHDARSGSKTRLRLLHR